MITPLEAIQIVEKRSLILSKSSEDGLWRVETQRGTRIGKQGRSSYLDAVEQAENLIVESESAAIRADKSRALDLLEKGLVNILIGETTQPDPEIPSRSIKVRTYSIQSVKDGKIVVVSTRSLLAAILDAEALGVLTLISAPLIGR